VRRREPDPTPRPARPFDDDKAASDLWLRIADPVFRRDSPELVALCSPRQLERMRAKRLRRAIERLGTEREESYALAPGGLEILKAAIAEEQGA
jgi:hypothetical protein